MLLGCPEFIAASRPGFPLTGFKVFQTALPPGDYIFCFALDDPDGAATGPWCGMDASNMRPQGPVLRRDGGAPPKTEGRVRLEIYGKEMVEKIVKMSGNSGRIYFPLDWVDSRVNNIRQD